LFISLELLVLSRNQKKKNKIVEYIKLFETSALALRFLQGQVCYSLAVEDYLSHLNLSAGYSQHEACNSIWPQYAEVIFNRKHIILHHIN
jgi:hypothetical protein